MELQKVSQQKNGILKGRVKLSTEGLDEENQAVELKDYGQYPWGLCEGSLFKPKLPRDRFLRDMCEKAIMVLGNSSVGNSCCAVTSMLLVGLLEAKIFTEDELMRPNADKSMCQHLS